MTAERREDEKPYPDFDTLFRAVTGPLTRYAWFELSNAADAQDLVQTAALNVFRNWPVVGSLTTAAKQRAYFRKAVTNELYQVWRRRHARPEVLSGHDIEIVAERTTAPESAGQEETGPALRQVWADIAGLPPACRRVVGLYAAGHDYGEIAEMLEISDGAVRSHMSEGRKRLRAARPDLRGED
jgi:RNA polymerase sigma-70 factor (ECF subfamily)